MLKNLIFVLLIFTQAVLTQQSSVPVFLLKSVNSALEMEKVNIAEGETKIFMRDGENITLILAVSTGMSGDFVKSDDKSILIARYKEGKLVISVQKQDGTQKELLSKTPDELSKYDIKVNVTSPSIKKVFVISGYDNISEDNSSPVIDMFQGKIPMNEGDYSITTEISEKSGSLNLEGETEIEYANGYYFTKLILNDGTVVNAVIDLGASHSIIMKGSLPAGVKTERSLIKEVSSEGVREIAETISGFGGELKELESCSIHKTVLGNLILEDLEYSVLDTVIKSGGKNIDAVIGLDILSMCSELQINIPNEKEKGRLVFKKTPGNEKALLNIPYTLNHGHIFVKGKVGNSIIDFIVDTGSPFNILTSNTAKKENIETEDFISVHGADGNKLKSKKGTADKVTLGDRQFQNTEFLVIDANIFDRYGISESGGIIGTELLKRFSVLTINFREKTIGLS